MSEEKQIVFNGPEDSLSDEAELLFTRNVRLSLIKQYTKNGIVPQDPEQAEVLLKALKDMDGSTFTRMKIRADDKANETNANSAALIAEALKSINGNTGRVEVDTATALTAIPEAVLQLPPHLQKAEVIPGELDQGTQNTTYEEFMKNAGTDEESE